MHNSRSKSNEITVNFDVYKVGFFYPTKVRTTDNEKKLLSVMYLQFFLSGLQKLSIDLSTWLLKQVSKILEA